MSEKDLKLYDDGELYDIFIKARDQGDYDLKFYLWAAKEYGDPILDLGCGTGRATLYLAKHGFNIMGLDLSNPLLLEAQTKASKEYLDVEFTYGDMSDFHLSKRFPLIITSGFAFAHLYSINQIYNHFQCIKNHLTDGGIYIFSQLNPNLNKILQEDEIYRGEYIDPKSGQLFKIYNKKKYDSKTQIQHNNYIFRSKEKEFIKTVGFRMMFPQELNAWLMLCGFEYIHKFGTFTRVPFEEDPFFQIVVCKVKSKFIV